MHQPRRPGDAVGDEKLPADQRGHSRRTSTPGPPETGGNKIHSGHGSPEPAHRRPATVVASGRPTSGSLAGAVRPPTCRYRRATAPNPVYRRERPRRGAVPRVEVITMDTGVRVFMAHLSVGRRAGQGITAPTAADFVWRVRERSALITSFRRVSGRSRKGAVALGVKPLSLLPLTLICTQSTHARGRQA